MHVISVNVGLPRKVQANGRTVLTSIYKTPVHGRVAVRGYNVEGDRQSDPRVHGGPYKAVYLYPSEHYAYWSKELPGADLPFGAFGENLTTAGLNEESAHIGDRFRIGSVMLQVTQPRMPCFKLALRFNRADMVQRFWNSGRSGMYFSIVREGELGAGDPFEQVAADPQQVSVADVVRLYKGDTKDGALYARALQAPLYGSWKQEIRSRRADAIY
jgi:MOSC domain-containing protein YiiM